MSDERDVDAVTPSTERSSQLDFLADTAARTPAAVPHGVNAESWLGFEQRIRERRLRAVHESLRVAIIAGDTAGAAAALEEARALQPESPELNKFAALVARMPSSPAVPAGEPFAIRVASAALLLLVGLAALFGLDWVRDPSAVPPTAAVTTADPGTAASDTTIPAAAMAPAADEASTLAPPDQPTAASHTTSVTLSPASARLPVSRAESPGPSPIAPAVPTTRERPAAGSAPAEADEAESRPVQLVEPSLPLPSAPALTPRAPLPAALPSLMAASAPAPATPPMTNLDERQIELVLQRYARAYAQLDARAAREIWPTVDERALARAFDNLSSQQVSFDRCAIAVDGPHAQASCQGQASYVGKVGNGEPRIEPRAWRFSLRRVGDEWKIETAAARRAVAESH